MIILFYLFIYSVIHLFQGDSVFKAIFARLDYGKEIFLFILHQTFLSIYLSIYWIKQYRQLFSKCFCFDQLKSPFGCYNIQLE